MEQGEIQIVLDEVQARVLGSLIEKEITTPEYYPLSLNSLINACNQKSNRYPVVAYDENTVIDTLDSLREKKLVMQSMASGRVVKYMQNLTSTLNLLPREIAVLDVLLLRGPQTLGELRGRTERMHKFEGLNEVQETLQSLMDGGFVKRLPRQPGRKEPRYGQLLCGDIFAEDDSAEAVAQAGRAGASGQDLQSLKQELDELRGEVRELRQEFMAFKKQFE